MSAEAKPNGLEFNANIDVVESLGSEKFVYFTRELGQTHNVAELEELARDSGRADTGGATETVVARLDPASRITEGEDARLWVDVRKLHVFDPATGRNLSLGAADSPGRAAAQAGCGGHGRRRAGAARLRATAAASRGSSPGRAGVRRRPTRPAGRTPGSPGRPLIPAVRACLAPAQEP